MDKTLIIHLYSPIDAIRAVFYFLPWGKMFKVATIIIILWNLLFLFSEYYSKNV